MKFFKFDLEGYDDGRYFFKTYYINVESIEDIIVESKSMVILRTRGGGVFYLNKEDSDRILKLIDLDEKEAKK